MTAMNNLILGVNGSPHKRGKGARLLRESLARCRKERFQTELVHLVDWETQFYHGNYTDRTPKGMEKVFQLVDQADGIVFSSPTYWFNVGSLMKNFIEQLTVLNFRKGEYTLRGKVAGFIATCEEDGGQAAINAMAAPLVHMGFLIPPQTMLFYNINMAEKSHEKWMLKDAPYVGLNVVRLVRLTKGQDWGYE